VFQQGGHGTAFDRVGAFQHGFISGAEGCKGLIDNPLPLINLTFTTADDAANQGNLPYADIEKSVVDDLSRFWTATFTANSLTFQVPTVASYPHDGPYPTCDGVGAEQWKFHAVYCPATNAIAYDDGFTQALYNKYGDFSVGYVLSNAWSEAVQTQLKSSLTGKSRVLLNDCLTGVWTKDIVPNGSADQQFSISPGDLDEAVSTALILDDASQSGAIVSAFDKIDNFRAGVLGGLSECNKRITGG
jgi:predicted metalloprotease